MEFVRINPYAMIKRIFDFIFSIFCLILILPVMGLLVFIIWIKLGRPVFFIQERPGRNGKIFKMIKFRTMSNTCDANGNLLADSLRTSGIGRFMRKTSLDELPEIFNVIKGDMSIIGPRPLLVKYLPYYTKRENKRHNIRPGITGLSQINGRNLLSWDERLEMDVIYVENQCIWLDIRILVLTFLKVIKQKDALPVSSEIIPDFDVYRKEQLKS